MNYDSGSFIVTSLNEIFQHQNCFHKYGLADSRPARFLLWVLEGILWRVTVCVLTPAQTITNIFTFFKIKAKLK